MAGLGSNIDFTDLSNRLTKTIADSLKKGFSQGLTGKSFVEDLNEQLIDFNKNQQARLFNEKVYQKTLQGGLSIKVAELETAAELAKAETNITLLANKQALARLEVLQAQAYLNTNVAEYLRLSKEIGALKTGIADLEQTNVAIQAGVEERRKQIELEEHQAELDERKEFVREKIEEINKSLRSQIGLTDELISLLKTPELAKAVFAEQMFEKLELAHEAFEEFGNMGLSVAQRITAIGDSFSVMAAIGLSDTKGVIEGMVESYGNLNALTSDQIDHVGHLAKEMGVTGQEAFALVDAFSKMPGETMETASNTLDFANHLAKANGLAPGKLTKDMAKNTETMALFSAKGAKGFATAAVELHKMGVEIGTASKLALGLLDFESSINKQMEASVLLGRQINFDKARELALSGDLEGSTKEVLKNIGGMGEFERMNVLQKQALAEATGMTVEEMQKAIDAQQEYNKYHGEEAGIWENTLGYAMEYGSAVGGFLKENGLLLISGIQLISQMGLVTKLAAAADATWAGVKKVFAFVTRQSTEAMIEENIVKEESAVANEMVGASASFAAGPMLAFGAAALMVGAGIGVAAYGLATLVSSFKDLTGEQILGGLGSMIIAIGGFTLSLYALSGALATMAATSVSALPVIAALVGLAAVAPALSGLGVSLGIGGETESKGGQIEGVKELVTEVKNMVSALKKPVPIIINLDGKKVGEGSYKASSATSSGGIIS